MNKLDRELEQAKKRYLELQQQKRELKRQEAKRESKKRGRKPLAADFLKKIKIACYSDTLSNVALRFGIGISTMHKYGITRQALDRETGL